MGLGIWLDGHAKAMAGAPADRGSQETEHTASDRGCHAHSRAALQTPFIRTKCPLPDPPEILVQQGGRTIQCACPIKKRSPENTTALGPGPRCARARPRVRCCLRLGRGLRWEYLRGHSCRGRNLSPSPQGLVSARSPKTGRSGCMQSPGLGSLRSLPQLGVPC